MGLSFAIEELLPSHIGALDKTKKWRLNSISLPAFSISRRSEENFISFQVDKIEKIDENGSNVDRAYEGQR